MYLNLFEYVLHIQWYGHVCKQQKVANSLRGVFNVFEHVWQMKCLVLYENKRSWCVHLDVFWLCLNIFGKYTSGENNCICCLSQQAYVTKSQEGGNYMWKVTGQLHAKLPKATLITRKQTRQIWGRGGGSKKCQLHAGGDKIDIDKIARSMQANMMHKR